MVLTLVVRYIWLTEVGDNIQKRDAEIADEFKLCIVKLRYFVFLNRTQFFPLSCMQYLLFKTDQHCAICVYDYTPTSQSQIFGSIIH